MGPFALEVLSSGYRSHNPQPYSKVGRYCTIDRTFELSFALSILLMIGNFSTRASKVTTSAYATGFRPVEQSDGMFTSSECYLFWALPYLSNGHASEAIIDVLYCNLA